MSMVDYWYEKGGVEKLKSQYVEFRNDHVLCMLDIHREAMEAAIVKRLKELTNDEEED